MEVKGIFIVGINFLQLYSQKRKKKVAKLLSLVKFQQLQAFDISPHLYSLWVHI